MKKTIIFAAAACLLMSAVSCQKENNETLVPENKTVLTGVIENTTTKTTIGDVSDNKCKVYWELSDEVNINGEICDAVPDDENATVATFDLSTGANEYRAIYPSSCYSSKLAAEQKYNLPSVYNNYQAGSFDHIPMYAYSESTTLSFKNIFAVVKVTVSATVTQVKVSSNVNLNGNFEVIQENEEDTQAQLVQDANASKTTTLNCGSGITGDIYIPVPAGSYTGQNLRVTITKSGGATETMTTKQTAEIELNANQIIAFTFTKNSFNLSDTPISSLL